MKLLVSRKWKRDSYTIGNLYVNNTLFSNTLEDKDRGLSNAMSPEEIKKIKVYGQTAIPVGEYEVRMTFSNKFSSRAWAKKYNGKTPELVGVKGFEGIRIHPGNVAQDTLGCILVGKNSAKGKVTESVNYYYKLLDNYIMPAIKKGEKISIVVE